MQVAYLNYSYLTFGTRKQFKKSFKTCAYCGGDFAPRNTRTIDHIRAKINGGSNDISNKITVCARCNREKSGDSLRDYIEKHPSVEKYLRLSVMEHAGQVYDGVDWSEAVKSTLKQEIGRDIFA